MSPEEQRADAIDAGLRWMESRHNRRFKRADLWGSIHDFRRYIESGDLPEGLAVFSQHDNGGT